MRWELRPLLFLFAAAFACAASPTNAKIDPADLQAAERAARNFLASIDAGNANGAEKLIFERELRAETSGRVTRSPIIQAHGAIESRRTYGRLKQRSLRKTELLSELSRFPSGKFMSFTYAVKFEKSEKEFTETLVIKADNPQRWSVVRFSLF